MFYDTILVNFTRGIKKMKKLLAITLAFMVFFSGCYQKAKGREYYGVFDEKIVAFAMKEDDKSFIILGEKYSYIFKPDKTLEYLIQNLNEAYKFDIENGGYTILSDEKNVVAGFKVIIDEENSSKELLSWAKKNGAYKPKIEGMEKYLFINMYMEGKLYLPNEELNKSVPKLDKEFKIKVKKERFVDTDRTELTKLGNFGAMMVFIPIFLILEVVD